jgi:predicted PolB exonuclease-like 3'-5' exonuclease
LVSFNGSSFDLPVLRYRAMMNLIRVQTQSDRLSRSPRRRAREASAAQ